LVLPGLLEHGRREVDAGGVAYRLGEGADDESAAAGDVEHGVVGTGSAELHDEPERRLVLDRRRRAEGHGLAGELVQDRIFVGAHDIASLASENVAVKSRGAHYQGAPVGATARRRL